MKMVSMKRSQSEKKASSKSLNAASSGEDIPYGLHVSLDNDSLDKLGMTTLPKVGDKLHVQAKAHVASVSESHNAGSGKNRHVELHLHHMAVGPADDTAEERAEGQKKGAKGAMEEAIEKVSGKV